MSNELFKDNFSQNPALYAKYRPRYPRAMYTFLAGLTMKHNIAWDCGTGNGQAAVDLASFYDRVIATDPSEQQIRHAIPHEKITYRVERAEQNTLARNTADLVVVANALHWMDFGRFFSEVNRVLKDDGIFAAWTYRLPLITPVIDDMLRRFHYETLAGFWQPENELIEQEYATIPFPFSPVETPCFFLERTMNLDDFTGYISTWSATQRFIAAKHADPTVDLKNELRKEWAHREMPIRWELILKVGRKNL